MKKYILILVGLSFIFSCSNKENIATLKKYSPLYKGSKWEFKAYSQGGIDRAVIEVVNYDPENKIYTMHTSMYKGAVLDYRLVSKIQRVKNGNMALSNVIDTSSRHSLELNKELVPEKYYTFKLPVELGKTWKGWDNKQYKIAGINKTIELNNKIYSGCIEVEIEDENTKIIVSIAPNIGNLENKTIDKKTNEVRLQLVLDNYYIPAT